MRTHITLAFSSLLVAFSLLTAPPIAADETADVAKCKEVLNGLDTTLFIVGAASGIVAVTAKGMVFAADKLDKLRKAKIATRDMNEAASVIVPVGEAASALTTPVQQVNGPIKLATNGVKAAQEYVIKPSDKALQEINQALETDKTIPMLRKGAVYVTYIGTGISVISFGLEGATFVVSKLCHLQQKWEKAEAPDLPNAGEYAAVGTETPGLIPAVYRGNTFVPKMNIATASKLTPEKERQCKRSVHDTLNGVDSILKKINPELQALKNDLSEPDRIIREQINPTLHRIEIITKPLDDVYRAITAIEKEFKAFEALLRHKIKVKIAAVTVVDASVHEVLHDWKRLIKKIEDTLHITEIKRLIEHEIEEVMRPVTNKLKDEVHHLEKSVKFDGYSLNDAKNAMRTMESRIEGLAKLKITDALKDWTHGAETVLKTCGA